MDFYISEFCKYNGTCTVTDYAVYLEKKKGFMRFNPFSSSEQMVIYITNEGNFMLKIDGMGHFNTPTLLYKGASLQLQFENDGKIVHNTLNQNRYSFVRKYKKGNLSNISEFANVIVDGI